MENLTGHTIARKAQSRSLSKSGKPYNHNTEAILWLRLFSQDLVKIWKHIVFISEGRKKSENWSSVSSPAAVGHRGADLELGTETRGAE